MKSRNADISTHLILKTQTSIWDPYSLNHPSFLLFLFFYSVEWGVFDSIPFKILNRSPTQHMNSFDLLIFQTNVFYYHNLKWNQLLPMCYFFLVQFYEGDQTTSSPGYGYWVWGDEGWEEYIHTLIDEISPWTASINTWNGSRRSTVIRTEDNFSWSSRSCCMNVLTIPFLQ